MSCFVGLCVLVAVHLEILIWRLSVIFKRIKEEGSQRLKKWWRGSKTSTLMIANPSSLPLSTNSRVYQTCSKDGQKEISISCEFHVFHFLFHNFQSQTECRRQTTFLNFSFSPTFTFPNPSTNPSNHLHLNFTSRNSSFSTFITFTFSTKIAFNLLSNSEQSYRF